MKLIVSMFVSIVFLSVAHADSKSPQFNKDRKMKSGEVIKKCGAWADKVTEKMKAGTPAEKKAKSEQFEKLAHSCTLNNGFDARGK